MTISGYVQNQPAYFGATIGRVANRIANGRFRLGTRLYEVTKNVGDFQLHGGKRGFDQVSFPFILMFVVYG
jgi:Galactose mutarotase and related enzymes